MRYCNQCGDKIETGARFCPNCGARAAAEETPVTPYPAPISESEPQPEREAAPVAVLEPQEQPAAPAVYSIPTARKKRWPFIAGISAAAFVLLCTVFYLIGTSGENAAVPAFAYAQRAPSPRVDYTVTQSVFPSLYRSLDALVTFTATCEGGEKEVLIEVEVPGFTQKYTQKVTLTEQITKLNIRPPLLTGDLNLNSEKDAQLVFSVTEADTGKKLVQDSKAITLKSKYDAVWWTKEYGDMNNDNILAWMTPEAPGVLALKRNAVDYLSYISDGAMQSIVGYQDYGFFQEPAYNTWAQAVAIQGAMSDIDKIRYNNAAFSVSSEAQQRVMLPDDVMASKSGICIETSLLMASALQSAGMHAVLIFPPGHTQVAVEAWPGTGEYFLIETTVLPMSQTEEAFDYVVRYMTKDEWVGYLDGTGGSSLGECYVLDCDLGQKLGILPMSN
ncbi:MAG: zinc-ribbon domain-containing protein [Oscillospiraceae bacterium]|jgi:hypothetical protein|nr:zinc-ribbon domain-containing protein [Oscillospiraceae bacterium]